LGRSSSADSKRNSPLAGVEHPFAEPHAFGARRFLARRQCLGAPQDRSNARDQFARAEGLGDVVVGAHFQPNDAVHFLAARRQ
jgi:hypothetical protein